MRNPGRKVSSLVNSEVQKKKRLSPCPWSCACQLLWASYHPAVVYSNAQCMRSKLSRLCNTGWRRAGRLPIKSSQITSLEASKLTIKVQMSRESPVACRTCSSPLRKSPAEWGTKKEKIRECFSLVHVGRFHIPCKTRRVITFHQNQVLLFVLASIPTFRLPICALCKKTSLAIEKQSFLKMPPVVSLRLPNIA